MDLKEMRISTRNWVDSALDRNYCECGIEYSLWTERGTCKAKIVEHKFAGGLEILSYLFALLPSVSQLSKQTPE